MICHTYTHQSVVLYYFLLYCDAEYSSDMPLWLWHSPCLLEWHCNLLWQDTTQWNRFASSLPHCACWGIILRMQIFFSGLYDVAVTIHRVIQLVTHSLYPFCYSYMHTLHLQSLVPCFIISPHDGKKSPITTLPFQWIILLFYIVLILNTAAYELWLALGMGNANFFYGMNLLWGGWQLLALNQLVGWVKNGTKRNVLWTCTFYNVDLCMHRKKTKT